MTDDPEFPNGEGPDQPDKKGAETGRDTKGRFTPGHEGLGGRPKGMRNRRSLEIDALIAKAGDLHPVEYLSQIVNGKVEGIEPAQRIAAAAALLPYTVAKRQPERFITEGFEIIEAPRSASEAGRQIADLYVRAAAGEISLDEASALTRVLRDYVAVYVGADLESFADQLEEKLRARLYHQ